MLKDKIFLKDVFITKLLKEEDCREYLASIIAAVLNLDKEYVLANLRLLDSEVSKNIHHKDQEVDVIVENEEMVVNIEINANDTEQSRIKNNSYIAQLVIRQTYPGKRYAIKPIVQINMNLFDAYAKNEFIYHSVMMEEKHHIKRRNSLIDIYDINLDFLSKMDYNQIKKLNEHDLQWLLYILVCQDKTHANHLYRESGMMKKVEMKKEDFLRELDSLLAYDHEEFHRREMEELKEKAVKEAREEGLKEGLEQSKKEMAKKSLKIGTLTLEQIAEITDLTIDEVKELQ